MAQPYSERYLSGSDLDKFVSSARKSLVNFYFSKSNLNFDMGKGIIDFLEGLEKKKVNYQINIESLPNYILDSDRMDIIKNLGGEKSDHVKRIYYI